MDSDLIRYRLKSFQEEVAKDIYFLHKGIKQESSLVDLYKEYKDLFDLNTLHSLIEECEGDKLNKNFWMTSALIKEYLIYFVQIYQAEIAIKRSRMKVNVFGEEFTLKVAQSKMITEKNSDFLKELYYKVDQVMEEQIYPLYLNMYKQLELLARENLSQRSYLDLCLKFQPFNFDDIIDQLENLLIKTEDYYFKLLSKVIKREFNLPYERLERHNIPKIWNLDRFSKYFKYENSFSVLEKLTRNLGLDTLLKKVEIEKLPVGKSLRSFCYPIEAPKHVVIVLALRGRIDDYKVLFHEAGHALHQTGLSDSLPIDVIRWADPSISEAYAFLFESVLNEEYFLFSEFGFSDNEYLDIIRLHKLFQLRQFSAKSIWELKYSNVDNHAKANKMWEKLMFNATGFNYPGIYSFIDRDFYLYSITYLRSWMLEGQLKKYLKKEFGQEWYTSKKAGEFLSMEWKNGEYYSAEDISKRLGYQKLDFDSLLEEYIPI
ncbi:oligoendopeptidase [Anoxybacillus flavithermus NBRC 109594]|uniref:Oligoendopeptidase n=1 Tax=Anoxybacillus flavithermus NBRC 109594 TaxID=1315967 RepID=R4FFI7_9BACL|nr:oligoendopeptidase [Anoxybacillus flavithermus]GAC91615.1 oligoendopeptidase [Anoxybacillus flavithermus NBRC 109594]